MINKVLTARNCAGAAGPDPAIGRVPASGRLEAFRAGAPTRGRRHAGAPSSGRLARQTSQPDIEPRSNPRHPVYNGAAASEGERAGHGLAGRGRYRRHVHGRGAGRRCERGRSASPRCRPRRAISREGVLAALEHGDAALRHGGRPTSGCCRTPPPSSPTPSCEEKGARAALITTRGFRDVLELRRSARADLYDLFQDAPATLIPRRRRFEITERIGADGSDRHAAGRERDRRLDRGAEGRSGCEAVAVSLLFSFLNPEHERRLGARLRAALPDVPVYLSSRGAAGDQGVRAHQHDRGVRLRRADPRLLSGAAGERHARARACRRST